MKLEEHAQRPAVLLVFDDGAVPLRERLVRAVETALAAEVQMSAGPTVETTGLGVRCDEQVDVRALLRRADAGVDAAAEAGVDVGAVDVLAGDEVPGHGWLSL
ncbi:hypothetical protein [Streptomyces kaniharaensis]|uniref:hypothetical protein n=1 Tax=Streptomyces kaniharaensis TaxID=212423 RepID=UPI0018A879D7|nr:hypothetical protein [Streptomyces kaniharaensis]